MNTKEESIRNLLNKKNCLFSHNNKIFECFKRLSDDEYEYNIYKSLEDYDNDEEPLDGGTFDGNATDFISELIETN